MPARFCAALGLSMLNPLSANPPVPYAPVLVANGVGNSVGVFPIDKTKNLLT